LVRLDQLGQKHHLASVKQVNLYEAKTSLSALVEAAAGGEEIIIAKNGKARARLTALPSEPRRARRYGVLAHTGWKLPENFNDPDPEIEALFYGEGKPNGEL
jgi:antitoxin (DNA-binding transcriptional repressor) of toxin-antitoxin stability system